MICPVCQLELGVERRAEELVVTYRFGDWRPQCPCPGAPVMCSNLLPTILPLLAESKAALVETDRLHQRRTG